VAVTEEVPCTVNTSCMGAAVLSHGVEARGNRPEVLRCSDGVLTWICCSVFREVVKFAWPGW